MLIASAMPALAQLVLSFRLPESPRWLIRRAKANDARTVLRHISPDLSAHAIERKIEEIQQALDHEDEETMPLKLNVGWLEGWRDRLWNDIPTRRALIVACGLQFFQQATGFNSLMYFSVTILKSAGFSSRPAAFAIFVAVANWICTLVALRIIDQMGRRRILLVGTSAMTVALASASFFFIFVDFDYSGEAHHQASMWSYLALISMVSFTCCYA